MSNKSNLFLTIMPEIVLDRAIGLTKSNPALTVEDIAFNVQDNKNDLNDTLIPCISLIIGNHYANGSNGVELAVESIMRFAPAS